MIVPECVLGVDVDDLAPVETVVARHLRRVILYVQEVVAHFV